MSLRIPLFVILAMIVATGCNDGVHRPDAPAKTNQDPHKLATKTLAGQITLENLPTHYGLSVSLAFFPVDGPDSNVPYDGDPPSDAISDCLKLYESVDINNECSDSIRSIPFSINHSSGYYYIQLRTLLYRKQNGKVFAQAEQFFFGRRPLELLIDLTSVTLPIEWPSIPLDELEHYGTVRPQKDQ